MAEIQLRNLSKRWGSFIGVHEFDLTIADREFLALLGPSGCGKTTTMRMIAGLEDVTEGEVVVDGKVINDLEPKDRDVAMVFQSYALYPNMNVYENIRFPLKVRKVDPASHDEKVMRAADMVELREFLHRKPAELSGGQRQRVALARAIVREPNVFLMLRSFFQNIPQELDEAARVDGCSHFQAFRRVIVPVMWPGVITTGLFSFLLAYNDFLVTSLLLDAQNRTMVPAIASMFNRETTASDEVQAIAAAVSITAPLFLLVMVFQRQIVSGLTAGTVKG